MPLPVPGSDPPKSTAPRRGFRAVAIPLAILVSLLVSEVGVRVYLGNRFVPGPDLGRPQNVLGEFDSDLGWRIRPSLSTRIVFHGQGLHVETDSRGFRSPEIPEPRTAGTFRILVLGDSEAWGWGVDQGEDFSARLPDLMGDGVEVFNTAVPGYSTDQQLWTLEKWGPRLRPDLVLLAVTGNDPIGNRLTLAHVMVKPRYERRDDGAWALVNHPVPERFDGVKPVDVPWTDRLASYSALLSLVVRARAEPPPVADGYDPNGWLGLRPQDCVDPEGVTFMLLDRLTRTCDRLECPLAVLVVPPFPDPDAYQRNPLAVRFRDGARLLFPLSQRLARVGEDLGFETVSVDAEQSRDVIRGRRITVPDGHWNAAGHDAAARALAPQLTRWDPRAR